MYRSASINLKYGCFLTNNAFLRSDYKHCYFTNPLARVGRNTGEIMTTIAMTHIPANTDIEIPLPGIIIRNWKLLVIFFSIGVLIMIVAHTSIRSNPAVDSCQWKVFINYQKELAERCGKLHLDAACQLPYPENQEFNWDNNMAIPTNNCNNL